MSSVALEFCRLARKSSLFSAQRGPPLPAVLASKLLLFEAVSFDFGTIITSYWTSHGLRTTVFSPACIHRHACWRLHRHSIPRLEQPASCRRHASISPKQGINAPSEITKNPTATSTDAGEITFVLRHLLWTVEGLHSNCDDESSRHPSCWLGRTPTNNKNTSHLPDSCVPNVGSLHSLYGAIHLIIALLKPWMSIQVLRFDFVVSSQGVLAPDTSAR